MINQTDICQKLVDESLETRTSKANVILLRNFLTNFEALYIFYTLIFWMNILEIEDEERRIFNGSYGEIEILYEAKYDII